MTVQTKSLFFYVEQIVLENQMLDFSEGGPNIAVTVNPGGYSPEQLLDIIQAAQNELGGQEYTWVLNRVTNKVTVSASSNFELNVTSGPNSGLSIFEVLGFTSDKTGSNSYEGDEIYASEFRPQFWLQKYVDPSRRIENVKATINESGNGDIETFSFGKRSFYKMDIMFITDIDQGVNAPIDTQVNAVQSAKNFMAFIIDKTNLEFMPARDDPDNFDTVLFESGPESGQGLGMELKEMTRKGLAEYFMTGMLTFRKVVL